MSARSRRAESSVPKVADGVGKVVSPTNGAQRSYAVPTGPRDALGTPISARMVLDLPPEVLEAVAERAAVLVAQGVGAAPEPWIGVDEAADYLCCPKSRVYRLVSRSKGHRESNPIPFAKDGSRVLFRRSELDRWIERGGASS